MLISKLKYYIRSLPTILMGMGDWRALLRALLGRPAAGFYTIDLGELGIRFKVHSRMDIWVIKEVCLDRAYALDGLYPEQNPVFIDIGACFGAFAVHAAHAFPLGRVFAYEPFPDSFNLLEENIRLNHLSNVRAFPYAVSDAAGAKRLYMDHQEPVRNSTVPPVGAICPQTLEVPSTSLDAIFAERDIEQCDLLKMDCEGAEYEILFAASDDTLRRIRRIVLEYHDWVVPFGHRDLARMLRERGFEVRVQPNPAYRGIGSLVAEAPLPAASERQGCLADASTPAAASRRMSPSSGRLTP